MTEPAHFTCPDCGRTSHNPNDARERYCGACHTFPYDRIEGKTRPGATTTANDRWRPSAYEAAEELARIIAKRRTGGAVFMGGQDNPTPGETHTARNFIQDLIDGGWHQPGADT